MNHVDIPPKPHFQITGLFQWAQPLEEMPTGCPVAVAKP
jgi:hypothetical protein